MNPLDALIIVTNCVVIAMLIEQRWAIYITKRGIDRLADNIGAAARAQTGVTRE